MVFINLIDVKNARIEIAIPKHELIPTLKRMRLQIFYGCVQINMCTFIRLDARESVKYRTSFFKQC